ncbi:MAG: hypothetical protein REJ23_06165 [Brevundimonas sp.]|nr:hypothetical protein [Brevundimonas sp.]
MPKTDDTIQVSLIIRGEKRAFWQTTATIASVRGSDVVMDGFDRPVTTSIGELKPAGANRWNLVWEIRTRP